MTSSAAFRSGVDRSEVLVSASRAVGHEGSPVIGAHLLDTNVDLLVVVDEVEHARRMAAQSEPMDNWDLLVVLTSLPRWEPVPLRSLTAEERRAVRHAPHGAVELAGDHVTRLVGPPLTRVLAVITDTDWDRGLNAASRFAPVATRMLVLDDEPADLPVAAAEAVEYGIGLAIGTAAPVRVVVEPERWQENYVTPGGWLFREQAYRVCCDQHPIVAYPVVAKARG